MWKDNVNDNFKYVMFSANSSLKGQSDFKKFEKARELNVKKMESFICEEEYMLYYFEGHDSLNLVQPPLLFTEMCRQDPERLHGRTQGQGHVSPPARHNHVPD